MPPFGKSGGSVELEIGPAVEVAFLIEMVVDRGLDGNEFLQTSHTPETEHCSLSSSKREVRILCPVIFPAAHRLFISIADNLHCRAV